MRGSRGCLRRWAWSICQALRKGALAVHARQSRVPGLCWCAGYGYTVADAVSDWLAFGLSGRNTNTIIKCTILANTHIVPALGARKLRDLSADDIDKWLADKAQVLSTRSLREVRSVLKRDHPSASQR